MSRRDQALLLDVVRQAAIAVRNATLARELQLARERLVLAREEDRRRIRRDLHDGLGPALGGVALRLDAAGNAIDTDPDRTRQLVRQSRQDVTGALADVRRLVHGLRPPALDDFGLAAALQNQVEAAASVLDVDLAAGELGELGIRIGRGIDPDAAAGVGLRSLRERAEELGGRCEVRCPEAGGTVVQAWIPIAEGLAP